MILFFTVDKQIITRQDYESVVQDSQNYLYTQFSFSEEWEGTITAVFKGKDGQTFNVLLDESGKCLVPWEVLTQTWFEVSVFCGNLITANVVRVYTIESGYEIGQESREPTPDIFNQIIEKIDDISAESIPYDNAQSGLSADNVQEAIDEIAEGGGGGGGTTPDIIMTASVDATTGTPDVEVTKTGTLTNPIFNLAFSGLKGETGAQGPAGADGADGSVVTVTQTLSSGTKIGSISVDGVNTDLFAPSGGGSNDPDLLIPFDCYQWGSGQENGFTSNNFFDKETGKFYILARSVSNAHRGLLEVDFNNRFNQPQRFCDLSGFEPSGSETNKLHSGSVNVRGIVKQNGCLLIAIRSTSTPNPSESDQNIYGILMCIELTNFTVVWSHGYNERLSGIKIATANNTTFMALPLRRKSIIFYTIDGDISGADGFSNLTQRDEQYTKGYPNPSNPDDYVRGMDENQKGEFCIVPTDMVSDINKLLTPYSTIKGKIIRWTGSATSSSKVDTGTLEANKYYQCQEVSTDTYKWVKVVPFNQVLYISAGYAGGVTVFDLTYLTTSSAADAYGHRSRVYGWFSTEHSSDWNILTYPEGTGGFYCFDLKVVYPYVFATLAPSPSVSSYDITNNTNFRRMGVLSLNISDLSNIGGYLGTLANMKGFIPIDEMAIEPAGSDFPPIFMELIGKHIFVNNGDKGAAVFDISNVDLQDPTNVNLPVFVENIKHPSFENVGGFSFVGDNQKFEKNFDGQMIYNTIDNGTVFMMMGENPAVQNTNTIDRNRAKNIAFYNVNISLINPSFYLDNLADIYEDEHTQP